ncbi:MAG TPA: 50S ribosomal protein L9 [Anaerolineae bacterium]|nr:50S ribosomal protein L9 [Anaerolineae bacterium]
MKVLLKEDVHNLGFAGEVHDVAAGYGRNYLVPRGLAIKATPKVLKQAQSWRQQAEARRAQLLAEYATLAEKIQEVTIEFTAKAGESGKLYGSVTTNDIVDKLNETLNISLDRRQITGDPLRQLGSHEVVVRLTKDIQPTVSVVIHGEDGVQAEADDEATAEIENALEDAVANDMVDVAAAEEIAEEVVEELEEEEAEA